MVKESDKRKDSFEIIVSAQDFPDSTIVKLYNRDIDRNIDSTFVINEKFILNGLEQILAKKYNYQIINVLT